MLSKRKSLNDDLIIWHGMSKQNISIAVKAGLPFAVRRQKIWLDIVRTEVQKKSKSIVAQNFAFSTRTNEAVFSILNHQLSQSNGPEDESSFVLVDLETRASEIVDALPHDLPIRIDKYNVVLVSQLAKVIATEMRINPEATKILSFLLYREQIPSNRRPCIPTGAEAYGIYRDIIESCINHKVSSIYKHMLSLDVDRELVWRLLAVGLSDLLPLVLRVRIVDMVLVNGCVVLVSVMLAYMTWRQEAFLETTNAADFARLAKVTTDQPPWLKDDELETFWQRCVETHNESFLLSYLQIVSLMRFKAVSMGQHRSMDLPVLRQFQHEIFSHRRYSWIGFDVDHTLVEYKLPFLLKASFEAAIKELQQSFIGLRAIAPALWIPELAQRGIAIDTNRGNFLHLTEDGTIQRAYHGSHEVSYFSINLLYGNYNKQDLSASSSKIIYLYTAADVIFAPLYAWIVDAFDSGSIAAEELGASLYVVPDIEEREFENPNDPFLANRLAYISLSSFALRAARTYYANAFWKTICSTPEVLIQPSVEIRETLDSLKTEHRKQLFILTNGSWTHCNEVMKFAVGKDWFQYFELVMTEAKKEIFFDELNDTPFMLVDPDNPLRGQKRVAAQLEKGKVYAGGNIHTLQQFLDKHAGEDEGPEPPERICYFGDHIMQDVIVPARNTKKWDLVAVVKEIQLLYQPPENEQTWTVTNWVYSLLSREAPRVPPELHSTFFFMGRNGTTTFFASQVLDAAMMCIHSVAKLARRQGVLKVHMLQQGLSRYSTTSDIKSMSKRVSAKVRAITKDMKNGHQVQQHRASMRSESHR